MKPDKTDKAIKAAVKAEAIRKTGIIKDDKAKLAKILKRANAKRD